MHNSNKLSNNNSVSIRLQKPSIRPLLWVVFFIVFFLLIIELLLKIPWNVSILPFPSPSTDSSFPELDVKFQRLRNVKNVNCMFFGSSMVDDGLDPQLFEKILNQQGDLQFTCFNMGFSASMVETSGVVANTLANWQPLKIVIFGISPVEMDRNFIKTRPIAEMPVFSYYNGNSTFTGWLFNKFNIPWFFAALPHLHNVDYTADLLGWNKLLDDRGTSRTEIIGDIQKGDQPPRLPGFKINPKDMEVLQSTMKNLESQNIKVIVVEMPVHPDYFPYLVEGGDSKYEEQFLLPVTKVLETAQIPFIRTQPIIDNLVDDTCWQNRNHFNNSGAIKFTSFIAQKILAEGYLH